MLSPRRTCECANLSPGRAGARAGGWWVAASPSRAWMHAMHVGDTSHAPCQAPLPLWSAPRGHTKRPCANSLQICAQCANLRTRKRVSPLHGRVARRGGKQWVVLHSSTIELSGTPKLSLQLPCGEPAAAPQGSRPLGEG